MKQAVGFLSGMVSPWLNKPKGSNKTIFRLNYSGVRGNCVSNDVKETYPTKEGSTLHSNGTLIGLTEDPVLCSTESL